jgi:two-component system phosphate regulon sensor histidine kinase PhoR
MTFFRSLQFRIVVASASLSIAVAVAVAVYVINDARDRAIETLETRVAEQASLIADTFNARLLGAPIADAAGAASNARVTILAPDGEVIEDSLAGIGERPGLINRPEVDAALHTGGSLSRGADPVLGGEAVIAVRVVSNDDGIAAIVRVALPVSEANRSIDGLIRTSAVGSAIAVLIATGFAVILSGRLTRTIAGVAAGARLVAAGDLEHRLRPESPFEFGQLAHAVNEMASRLSELITSESEARNRIESILSTMSDGVIVVDAGGTVRLANPAALAMLEASPEFDVGQPLYTLNWNHELIDLAVNTARTGERSFGEIDFLDTRKYLHVLAVPLPADEDGAASHEAIVVLTDLTEFHRVDNTRREFVSNASHELRTPLTGITASVETLRSGVMSEPEIAEDFLGRIANDADRMARLVDEMLELASVESAAGISRMEAVDPTSLATASIDRFKPQARRAGVAVILKSDEPPEIQGDTARLEQAIDNLISNAIKATPEQGEIVVSVAPDGAFVNLAVTDSGPGIEPEHLPHVFERFYRIDRARSSGNSNPGSGLGLAITRHIVEAHGGKADVESAPGESTTFTLRLPVRPPLLQMGVSENSD